MILCAHPQQTIENAVKGAITPYGYRIRTVHGSIEGREMEETETDLFIHIRQML